MPATLGGALTCQQPPQDEKRKNDGKTKNSVTSSLGVRCEGVVVGMVAGGIKDRGSE